VWDTEAAEPKTEDESWDEYRLRAGISWATVFDVETGRFEHFDRHTILGLVMRLETAHEVIGYNSRGYDQLVVESLLKRSLKISGNLDLWDMIKNHDHRRWPRGSWTLDAVCSRTFGEGKTRQGAAAPSLAKEGRWAELASYCESDVRLTYKLWEFIAKYGYVIDPEGRMLPLRPS